MVEGPKVCAYCGSSERLAREHVVPKSLKVKAECSSCPKTQEIHNQVWACASCNSAQGTQGIYRFYQRRNPGDAQFYDNIPPLLEKKYLKTIHGCHACAGTLDSTDLDGDRKMSVIDVDHIVAQYA